MERGNFSAAEPEDQVVQRLGRISHLLDGGQYAPALKEASEAMQYSLKELGEDHSHTAMIYLYLGQIHTAQDELLAAEKYYRKGLAYFQKSLGVHHEFCLDLQLDLGNNLLFQARYNEALALFQESHTHMTAETLTRIAFDCQVCLGKVFKFLGKLKKAETCFRKAVALSKKVREHSSFMAPAEPHVLLGQLYLESGRGQEALRCYRNGEKYFKSARGLKTHAYAAFLLHFQEFYIWKKQWATAEQMGEKACSVAKALYGEGHLFYLSCLQNLAEVYRSCKKYGEAEALYKDILGRLQNLPPGLESVFGGHVLMDFAVTKEDAGQLKQAESFYRWAEDIFQTELGEGHPLIEFIYYSLEGLYTALGQKENAQKYREKAERVVS
jgi:tetratricopeptide (TPR) repeat protein